MRPLDLRLAAAIPAALVLLSGCGTSPSAVATDPPTATPTTPVPTSAPATSAPMPVDPTPAPKPSNALDITQVGIRMLVPGGLTWVSYHITGSSSGTDAHGATYHETDVLLSTPQYDAAFGKDAGYCAGSESFEEVLVIYDEDPSNLEPGPFSTDVLARVNGHFLTLQVPDGGPCSAATGAVFDEQAPLLTAMVRTAEPLP